MKQSDSISEKVHSTFASYITHEQTTDESSRPHHLRMLIPASSADAKLCKTVISSAVLGYPAPILINWNKQFEDPALIFGGSHIAKIEGVLAHLKTLDSSNDNDLVMVADGYDVWFQLRPSVMINRYFEINNAANARLREQHDHDIASKGVEQKVLFSSQKRCWPMQANHPACYAVPESTLPRDVYGEKTDMDVGDEANPYVKFRQQFLNSGACVGPVSAVRAVFERANQMMHKDKNIGSDQGIFAEMFGQQEFMRHVMKYRSRSFFRRFLDFVAKTRGREYSYKIIDPVNKGPETNGEPRVTMSLEPDNPLAFEFGIGLDYKSEILQATVFSEYDTEWLERQDKQRIKAVSTEKGVPMPPRVGQLPREVLTSLQPFYSSRQGYFEDSRLPVEKTWNQVPLFTNVWSGISPVAVHHNAHRDGLKGRIESHWPYPWFQPYLRALLDQRSLSPQHQVAVTYANGSEQAWYSPTYSSWENEFSGVYTDGPENGYWGDFDMLCEGEGIWEEIFRDGKGPWADPRYREPAPEVHEDNELDEVHEDNELDKVDDLDEVDELDVVDEVTDINGTNELNNATEVN